MTEQIELQGEYFTDDEAEDIELAKINKFKQNIWKAHVYKFCISLYFLGGVLVPFFTRWGGISFGQIMFLQSWFMFWFFILSIPSGIIADFIGRKVILSISCAINIIAIFTYVSMPNFYIFLIGEFLWAVAESFVSGASEAFLYDSLKEINKTKKSKKLFGRFESFSAIGLMISAPIGSLIAFYFGLTAPMFLMGIPLFAAFIISFSFKEPKIEIKKQKKEYLKVIRQGFKIFRKNRFLILMVIDMVSIETIACLMIWLYQPLLAGFHINYLFYGFVYSALIGTQILIMNNYGRLEKIFGNKRGFLLFSAIITGIMFIIGGLSSLLPIVILSIILVGFGLARRPLFINYLNKHVPSAQRASVLSNIDMIQTLFSAFAYWSVGIAVDWSLNATLMIMGITIIIFSLIFRVKEKHLVD
ncbi:MAG: MFS transporter [Candidatus Lokiarchaeota archaeon]|nr:MFS transporter [Candidatus Lokiarchaeota archaeon]